MKSIYWGASGNRIALGCLICCILIFAGCEKKKSDDVTKSEKGSRRSEMSSNGSENRTSKPAVPATWLVSWDEAMTASKQTGKPVMADFTGKEW